MRCGIHGWEPGATDAVRVDWCKDDGRTEGFLRRFHPHGWSARSGRCRGQKKVSKGLGAPGFLEIDDGCSSAGNAEHLRQTGEQAASSIRAG